MEGTLIRLQVEHLPGQQDPKPLWLWWSQIDATPADVDRCWQAFLRRFDLEHTFRMFKQTLGWTVPKIRDPAAGDRWTWLIITAHTQLRLARGRTDDLRRPWERPAPPERLTPARVRRHPLHPFRAPPPRRQTRQTTRDEASPNEATWLNAKLSPEAQDKQVPVLLRHVFVAQQVRPDPPPVELPRDLRRRSSKEVILTRMSCRRIWTWRGWPRPARPTVTATGNVRDCLCELQGGYPHGDRPLRLPESSVAAGDGDGVV